MLRAEIANIILKKLEEEKHSLKKTFAETKEQIGYFYIDNLLPNNLIEKASNAFPDASEMVLKKSLKEYKYISAQMNQHDSILEEILYAFQDERIVQLIREICEIDVAIFADESLYAGGISLMEKGCFLNPHLDNSHDNDRSMWRVLNLLYYVSPDWSKDDGGNLELWPNGPKGEPIEIISKYNRLAIMATHKDSWHSVNEVKNLNGRKCISNYYFSEEPLEKHQSFHVTSFKGRPNQVLRNLILTVDNALRMGVRSFFKKGIRKKPACL